jgi:hypothetical protein
VHLRATKSTTLGRFGEPEHGFSVDLNWVPTLGGSPNHLVLGRLPIVVGAHPWPSSGAITVALVQMVHTVSQEFSWATAEGDQDSGICRRW